MIRVTYSTIDYFRKSRTFKTLKGARKFAYNWVGEDADIGSGYAVATDGVGKVTVSGATLAELFDRDDGSFERKRNADMIDGMDRDDLGESPDY